VYAVGIPACPHCGVADYEEDGVAKASAEAGATHYLAAGDPVPDDLPEGVRLVGPGAPAVPESVADLDALDEVLAASEPDDAAEDVSEPQGPPGPSTPPGNSGASSDPDDEDAPADYAAYPIRVLRDLCRERGLSPSGSKADLVARLESG